MLLTPSAIACTAKTDGSTVQVADSAGATRAKQSAALPTVSQDQTEAPDSEGCSAQICGEYSCCSHVSGPASCTGSMSMSDYCGYSPPIRGACLCTCSSCA